jgi:outer membrane receptor protein involved in Fe transport
MNLKKKSLFLAMSLLLIQQQVMAQAPEADDLEELAAPRPVPAAGGEIEEIVTLGKYIPDEKRATAAVSNVLNTAALERAGDSNIAEGLKRLSGLNLSEGKFVFIRGLGERYSAAMVNGATLPSPEPITRAVPIDLFPANIIDTVLVQKTFSAAFPAEFAGGMIEMRTKVVPEEPFFELSSSIGYNDITSFKDGLTYDGGSRDWMGLDKGTRDESDLLKSAVAGDRELRENNFIYKEGFEASELEAIGESLPVVYTPRAEDISPDMSVGANFGTMLQRGDFRLGMLSNLSYSNSWESLKASRNTYASDVSGGLEGANLQEFRSTQQNVDSSMFWNVGLEYQDAHALTFTVLQIHKTDDLAGLTTGLLGTEGANTRQTRLEWIEQDLLTNQLQGRHSFYEGFGWEELTVEWHVNQSRAKREAPDMRQFRYDEEEQTGDYLFCLRAVCNQRVWSDLLDENEDYGISAALALNTPFDTYTTLKAGTSRIRKDRDAELRRYSFISGGALSNDRSLRLNPRLEDVINSTTIGNRGFQIKESTQPTDNYFASQAIDAMYIESDIELSPSFRLMAGVRQEESVQDVTTFNLFNPTRREEAQLEDDNLYPTVTGTWVLDRYDMQVRAGYSETTSRPDFRELSRAPFIHPVTGLEIVGNPDLTVAFVENYDLRWEWYFAADESVSIGLFHKDFTNPIEAIIEPGIDNRRTFVNAQAGQVQGVEFDGFRWLEWVSPRLESWFTAANLTLIDSEVVIKPEDAGILTSSTRQLQGQADYIINLQLGYDDGFKHNASIVFHQTGERIREAGVLGAPDVIDEAYGELDANYIYTMNEHLRLNLKARNLLQMDREATQGGLDANTWIEGRVFSVAMTYTF